ncbi:MAG: apolipoprotein N-acyltransferase, partial [Mycobacteriaceae bacterium]|nr:apolipoprotein N-acyltransferase [Mycobacteriaceae bacterium]
LMRRSVSGAAALRWLASAPAVALAGVAHTLSFSPFEGWWLQLLALGVLAHATMNAAPRRAAWLGWLFAVGWLVSGFWWLYVSMHDYGGMNPVLAAVAVLVLAALLGLYYAAAMGAWARLRTGGPGWDALLWPVCWMLAELARGMVFTGFPWIASGYAHAVGPLAAWAPWVGVYGLCLWAAAVAHAGARWLQPGPLRQRAQLSVAVFSMALAALALPDRFTQSVGPLRVSLLQPNVAQDLKFDPNRLETQLSGLVRQLSEARGQLVVTPESVLPVARSQLGEGYWQALQATLRPPSGDDTAVRAALIGIFVGDDESGYVNSVVALSSPVAAEPHAASPGPNAAEYRYGKRHLLPFGEIIPPGFHWFVDLMKIPLADQARGRTTEAFAFAGQRLRPLVCYEDLFGEDIVSSVVGPQAATVFVNVSNLAWFGRWLVQDQHLQFSQMRAIEFQRPVIRSTNTGATAVVDHRGRVIARMPPLTTGILEATVEGRTGATPYARWLSAFGLWPWVAAGLAVMGAAAWRGPAPHRPPRQAAAPRP